ncbi:methyltransferase domain-containing protein [Streptomyces sp. ITFR-6]|uniref:methyltransferase domain-containing protein n=1 Tax=Streptomyces sp. ITFR-6 TaxID=3075197 RepID=UPI00288A2F07|nr:methyltransferase domain-containing protein [Streptomyces sp. ITFR-6]WNI28567.1 methyltransferase domain-containing protein [Streptomyces sp. ITFR-6]
MKGAPPESCRGGAHEEVAVEVGPRPDASVARHGRRGGREAASDVVEVLRHDVAADPPPPGGFDLVHARLVLVHVVDRAEALRRMVQALRPGGVLLLEDADPGLQPLLCPDESGPEQRLANRLRSGFRELMAGRGADLAYGRTLPRRLREAGLLDVRADAYFPITSPACTVLEAATVRQIRERLVAAGIASDADIDRHLSNVATGELDLATAPMISAWGRRPQGGSRPGQDSRSA